MNASTEKPRGSFVNSIGISLDTAEGEDNKCISVSLSGLPAPHHNSMFLHGSYVAMRKFAQAILSQLPNPAVEDHEKAVKEMQTRHRIELNDLMAKKPA